MTIRLGPALLALVLMVAPRAAAQTAPTPLDDILKLPLSPGSVAWLVQHMSQPSAQVRLGAALRDSQPNVRAAAARVIFIAGIRGMAGPIMVALGSETSPEAAAEQIRFLAHFGTSDHRRVIDEALARLGPRAGATAAIELARSEGAAVLSRLAAFRAADISTARLATVIAMAAKDDRAVLEGLLRDALAARDDRLTAAILDAALDQKVLDLPEPLLLAVLTHDAPAVTIQGVWYVARSWDGTSRWNPSILAAMHTAIEARTAGDSSPTVRFAGEIVARHQGVPPSTSREWQALLSSADATMRFLLERPFAINVLSTKELDTAGAPLLTSAKELRESLTRKPAPPPQAAPKNPLALPAIEAASDYPPEFATDVFKVTGCRLDGEADRTKSDGAAGGIVTLREHGRPASIAALTARVAQPACLTASSILVATAVTPRLRDETPTEKTVLVPFDSEFFACQEGYYRRPVTISAKDGAEPWRTGRSGLANVPTKIKNVPPIYPAAAQQEGVRGIVIMEATITPEGCVSRTRVLRGVDGRLDWAAVRAVLQWKFAPTVVDGVPVPVILVVTVQFTLS